MSPNITVHAIEQFIRRWEPNKTAEEAEEELVALLSTSRIVGHTRTGESIHVSGHRPEVRMVLKERNVCITVLPPPNPSPFSFSPEELELLEELNPFRDTVMDLRIPILEEEIRQLQQEIADLDVQRRALGDQKTHLVNVLAQTRRELDRVNRGK